MKVEQMTNAEYHAHPAVSKSVLDRVAKSPKHALAYLNGARKEPTAAMRFGSALHMYVLEPDLFRATYSEFNGDRRTKAGREEYEQIIAIGKQPIQIVEIEQFEKMRASIFTLSCNPIAGKGRIESSVFWTDEASGLECKCRPDWWDGETIVDLKSTDDASPEGFARSVAGYRYHVQAAHYMAGTGVKRFVFIAVEKQEPHAVGIYELDEISLEYGQQIRAQELETLAECKRTNIWPGYADGLQTIGLPSWAYKKTEETIEVNYV